MRERLVVTLVGMTLAVIALFGVPRAYETAHLVADQEREAVDRTVGLAATAVEARRASGEPVDAGFLRSLAGDGERISVTAADGATAMTGDPVGDDAFTASRELRGGGEVTVQRGRDAVDERVSDALTPLVLLALGLAVLSAVVGFVLARRLAHPFRRLAESARVLGTGRFDVDVPHSRVPEAEALGDALRSTARQLDDLVTRERQLAVTASHELRTPVTSLRLVLEDLSFWPQTPPDVAQELTAALGELDRLDAAIGDLLDRKGANLGQAVDVDLVRLVAGTIDRFREPARAAGRSLRLGGDDEVPVTLVPGPVAQVVEALLDNALAHGRGTISVVVSRERSYDVVSVSDEGPRTAAPGVIHQVRGVGGGLSAISLLAESMGGQLLVDDAATTRYVLRLPRTGGDDVLA
jgi:signal transduction histidine kinase